MGDIADFGGIHHGFPGQAQGPDVPEDVVSEDIGVVEDHRGVAEAEARAPVMERAPPPAS